MPDITLTTLQSLKQSGEKIAMLTCYDATFAQAACQAGVEVLLVGDSLGMVLQGHDSTLPVNVADMAYHTASVKRGNQGALILVDLPFMAYATTEQTLHNCAALMQAGAHMVKLEGAAWLAEPMRPDAMALEQAGAAMLLLECVPSELAAEISQAVKIPVIGIGAGSATDGQVLVLHDMLGLSLSGRTPKFVKNFMAGQSSIQHALSAYVKAVKDQSFPAAEHGFSA